MLSCLAALVLLQMPPASSTHRDIQEFKFNKTKGLDNVRMVFAMQNGDSEIVWKVTKRGRVCNVEVAVDGEPQAQISIGNAVCYFVSHTTKAYSEVDPEQALPRDPQFELPAPEDDTVSASFQNFWFYITAGLPMKVDSFKEESIDGRKRAAAVYSFSKNGKSGTAREWIDLKTGLVERFSVRTKSDEEEKLVEGWITELQTDFKDDFTSELFDPAKHPDYTKQ